MGVTGAVLATVVAASAAGYQMNQAAHAKADAAEQADKEKNALNDQIKSATTDPNAPGSQAKLNQDSSNQAGASQAAMIAALKAAMSTNSSMGGTILSGPQGAPVAPTQSKTLLGV